MSEKKVAVTCLATGAYVDFVQQWKRSISLYLPNAECFVLSDALSAHGFGDGLRILPWGHLPWPNSTTFRHSALLAYRDLFAKFDVLIHMDVDAEFISQPSIPASNLFALSHPGYENVDGTHAPFENREDCSAYVPLENRRRYLAGGFQGGRVDSYLSACLEIREWSLRDLVNDIVPVWHDESYWNRLCSEREDVEVLSGSGQNVSGLLERPPFIHFLEKDHDFYRFPDRRFRHLRSFFRSCALRRLWRRSIPSRLCRRIAGLISSKSKKLGLPW